MQRRRRGVSTIVGTMIFVLIILLAISTFIVMFNSFSNYANTLKGIDQQAIQEKSVSLSIPSMSFGSSPTTVASASAQTVTTSTSTDPNTGFSAATEYTFDRKLTYASGLWWLFYSNGASIFYRTSAGGDVWSAPVIAVTNDGNGLGSLGYNYNIFVTGTTIYYVFTRYGSTNHFDWGQGTLQSSGAIAWTTAKATQATTNTVRSYASITVDTSGNIWVALNTHTGPAEHIEVWERVVTTWSKVDDITLGNANDWIPIVLQLSGGDIALIYGDTGGNTQAFVTGTVDIITTANGGVSWSAAISPPSTYDLSSSSAIAIGATIYFSGYASAGAGGTTGTLNFWTYTFGGGTTSAETTLDATVNTWLASISQNGTASSNNLVVTYGAGTSVFYVSSTNLGATWSTTQTVSTIENNIAGLTATYTGPLAVVWGIGAGSPFSLRFVGANSSQFATSYSDQRKLFYAQGLWWLFYSTGMDAATNGIVFQTSADGVTWSAPTSLLVLAGSQFAYAFSLWVNGNTIYYVLSSPDLATTFTWRYGTLNAAGTITWTIAQTNHGATYTAYYYNSIVTDSGGNTWIALHTLQTATTNHIEVWLHAFGAGAGTWTKVNDITGLAADVAPILVPQAVGGVALIYGSGSVTAPVLITTSLTGALWSSPVSPPSDYALFSSSALSVGNTIYFAGLASASAGVTSGTVNFWSYANGAIATSSETTIVSTVGSWNDSISNSGNTLTVFYGAGGLLNYTSSTTLGSSWNSPSTISTSEAAITGVTSSYSGDGVVWASGNFGPFNVRFDSLSIVQGQNSSPTAVHVISLYIHDTTADTLTHYDTNASAPGVSGVFDYWLGEGETLNIPVSFAAVPGDSYLITLATDQGLVFSATFTAP
ncbi:MAG: beta strand repeat-containing protein [Nitrososphaerales archaeon]